jgi:hypothetical protein
VPVDSSRRRNTIVHFLSDRVFADIGLTPEAEDRKR